MNALIDDHLDAVEAHHRFPPVSYAGALWDLAHLDPFALHVDIGEGLVVTVVVLFSCHCFTHAIDSDDRPQIPASEVFWNNRERRVLNAERYRLSRQFLPALISDLSNRHIQTAPHQKFVTMEVTNSEGRTMYYAVFFEVEKDRHRKKRLLLRVQSAYPIESLDRRQQKAGKVRFAVLVRAAYNGSPIKG